MQKLRWRRAQQKVSAAGAIAELKRRKSIAVIDSPLLSTLSADGPQPTSAPAPALPELAEGGDEEEQDSAEKEPQPQPAEGTPTSPPKPAEEKPPEAEPPKKDE